MDHFLQPVILEVPLVKSRSIDLETSPRHLISRSSSIGYSLGHRNNGDLPPFCAAFDPVQVPNRAPAPPRALPSPVSPHRPAISPQTSRSHLGLFGPTSDPLVPLLVPSSTLLASSISPIRIYPIADFPLLPISQSPLTTD